MLHAMEAQQKCKTEVKVDAQLHVLTILEIVSHTGNDHCPAATYSHEKLNSIQLNSHSLTHSLTYSFIHSFILMELTKKKRLNNRCL